MGKSSAAGVLGVSNAEGIDLKLGNRRIDVGQFVMRCVGNDGFLACVQKE